MLGSVVVVDGNSVVGTDVMGGLFGAFVHPLQVNRSNRIKIEMKVNRRFIYEDRLQCYNSFVLGSRFVRFFS
jgi:hypothetical protein